MRSVFFTIVLIAAFSVDGVAQLSIQEFLSSALSDPEVKTYNEQVDYLQKKPYRLSPLREVEFRMQNRELIAQRQEYALRFSPSNPWEMRSNNLYFKDLRHAITLQKQLAFKEALADRYYGIIAFLYLSAHQRLLEESARFLTAQVTMLEELSGSSYFDAGEYVKLQVSQLDNEVLKEEAGYELMNQTYLIKRMYPLAKDRAVDWSSESIISVERIMIVVDSLTRQSVSSTMLAYQQQKINVARRAYNVEKSNINVGFFQTEYDRRRVVQDRYPWNISFGVTIPIVNPNKPDMAKRKLKMIEAQFDLEETEAENELDVLLVQDKLRSLARRYRDLKKRIAELEGGDLAETLATLKGADPLIYVQFNERLMKMKTLLLKMERNIWSSYIDYLVFHDHLQQLPLINFLSDQLEVINTGGR